MLLTTLSFRDIGGDIFECINDGGGVITCCLFSMSKVSVGMQTPFYNIHEQKSFPPLLFRIDLHSFYYNATPMKNQMHFASKSLTPNNFLPANNLLRYFEKFGMAFIFFYNI